MINVKFVDNDSPFDFLEVSSQAALLWSDSEDLFVLSNLFQLKIKVFTVFTEEKKSPTVNWIHPDITMVKEADMSVGQVPDMILFHTNGSHFNLVISKDSRLALHSEQILLNSRTR